MDIQYYMVYIYHHGINTNKHDGIKCLSGFGAHPTSLPWKQLLSSYGCRMTGLLVSQHDAHGFVG